MSTYADLMIIDSDISTDAAGQPITIYDRDVIAQDVRHAILESGLLADLIGERSKQRRALALKNIRLIAEQDTRITPGTVGVSEQFTSLDRVTITVTADTEFGPISIGV